MDENPSISLTRGVITDCLCTPITEKPAPPSEENEIVAILSALSEVFVILAESTTDYYMVLTTSGVSGYCPKKRIAIAREDADHG